MFFKLFLENINGDRVDMTATANLYMTSKVEELNPPTGTISTSRYAGMEGSYLNNAFIEKRNVVISFEMRGVGVEARRFRSVKPFPNSAVSLSERYFKMFLPYSALSFSLQALYICSPISQYAMTIAEFTAVYTLFCAVITKERTEV